MGILAALVKQAAPTTRMPEEFMSRLEQLEQEAGAPTTGEADLAQMSAANLPTTGQESWRHALKWLAVSGATAATVGAALRLLRARSESKRRERLVSELDPYLGMPLREIAVPIAAPKRSNVDIALLKEAGVLLPALGVSALAAPSLMRGAGSNVGQVAESMKEKGHGLARHLFERTGNASDNPWFYPALLAATTVAGYAGYKGLDALLNTMRERRSSRTIDQAKQEFEQALRTQYEQSGLAEQAGVKTSADQLGLIADAFGRAHVSGELAEQLATLEKVGFDEEGKLTSTTRGLGNKALGLYLTALAVLTAAGGVGGYQYVKSRETGRRKYEVAKDILRRRQLARPAMVTVEST